MGGEKAVACFDARRTSLVGPRTIALSARSRSPAETKSRRWLEIASEGRRRPTPQVAQPCLSRRPFGRHRLRSAIGPPSQVGRHEAVMPPRELRRVHMLQKTFPPCRRTDRLIRRGNRRRWRGHGRRRSWPPPTAATQRPRPLLLDGPCASVAGCARQCACRRSRRTTSCP